MSLMVTQTEEGDQTTIDIKGNSDEFAGVIGALLWAVQNNRLIDGVDTYNEIITKAAELIEEIRDNGGTLEKCFDKVEED